MVTRAGEGGADLLQAQSSDGSVMSAILPSGAWLSDRADGGVILKDARGTLLATVRIDRRHRADIPIGGGPTLWVALSSRACAIRMRWDG